MSVWQPDGTFICHAASNQRLPANASAEDRREGIKRKRRASRALLAYHQQRQRMHRDVTQLTIEAAEDRARAEAAAPDPNLPPTSIVPLRTDQLPALQSALEDAAKLRKAVGAEGLSRKADVQELLRLAMEKDRQEAEEREAREVVDQGAQWRAVMAWSDNERRKRREEAEDDHV